MNLLRRLGISKFLIKNWKRISFVSSRKLQKRVKSGYPSNLIALKGTAVSVDPTAYIEVGVGKIIINDSWCSENPFPTLFSLRARARLIVHGYFNFHSNADISINENAVLEVGSGFVNRGARIHCFNSIKIGNHVYIGEDVLIKDSDGHEIIGSERPVSMPIVVGDHVWIGANVTLLKGVSIGDGAVVAAGAVVTKDVPPHTLAAGVPARVVKEFVAWR